MMLFWAGLRGAVGVALASGFKGENAEIFANDCVGRGGFDRNHLRRDDGKDVGDSWD